MPTPGMVTVSDTYKQYDGTPEQGRVEFTGPPFVNDADGGCTRVGTTRRDFDENGHFTVDLLPTDGLGFTYEVRLWVGADTLGPFNIELPAAAGAVTLRQLAPVASSDGELRVLPIVESVNGHGPDPHGNVDLTGDYATPGELSAAQAAAAAATATERARAIAVEAVKADLVAGVVPLSQISPTAFSRAYDVADIDAMLSLDVGGQGAVAIVAEDDDGEPAAFLLNAGDDPTDLAKWHELPLDPTGAAAAAQVAAEGYADLAVAAERTRAVAVEAGKVELTDPRLADERVPVDGSVTLAKLAAAVIAAFDAAGAAAAAIASANGYTDAKVAALVDGAPGALDTLLELANELTADESVVTALTSTVAGKVALATLTAANQLYVSTGAGAVAAVDVPASTFFGRKATGPAVAMTPTEAKALLDPALSASYVTLAGREVLADAASGSDDTTSLQSFADAAKAAGTVLRLRPGIYRTSALSLNDASGLIVAGAATGNASAQEPATILRALGAGAGSLLTGRRSNGLTLRDVKVENTDAGFTGTLIDLRGDNTADTGNPTLENVHVGGDASARATALGIALDGSYGFTMRRGMVQWCDIGVLGFPAAGGRGYANAVEFLGTHFSANNSTHFRHAGNSWLFSNVIFSNLKGGYAGAYKGNDPAAPTPNGVVFVACWAGDITAGTDPQFEVNGDGFVFIGGKVGIGGGTGFKFIVNGTRGFQVLAIDLHGDGTGYLIDLNGTSGHVRWNVQATSGGGWNFMPAGQMPPLGSTWYDTTGYNVRQVIHRAPAAGDWDAWYDISGNKRFAVKDAGEHYWPASDGSDDVGAHLYRQGTRAMRFSGQLRVDEGVQVKVATHAPPTDADVNGATPADGHAIAGSDGRLYLRSGGVYVPMTCQPKAEWMISGEATSDINWHSFPAATSTTALSVYRDSTGAQNAEVVSPTFPLIAGTYSLALIYLKGAARGIFTLSVSSDLSTWTDVGTIDGYNATTLASRDELTGIVIPKIGVWYVRLKMATKNASATNYQGSAAHLSMIRTGA